MYSINAVDLILFVSPPIKRLLSSASFHNIIAIRAIILNISHISLAYNHELQFLLSAYLLRVYILRYNANIFVDVVYDVLMLRPLQIAAEMMRS